MALAKILVLRGLNFFICQAISKQAKSLGSRLEPLKSLLPWGRISLRGLGRTEPSGGSPVERPRLQGFESCSLRQGLIHSAMEGFAFPLLALGWNS